MNSKISALTAGILAFIVMSHAQGQTEDYVTDHVFTKGIEGPAVDAAGNLYVVNIGKEGTIGIVDKKDNATLFLTLPEGSVGNGIRFDRNGQMFVADFTAHNILKINPQTKAVSVYAHSDAMNQPNDIAISRSGIIYASDPNWKAKNGRIWKIDLQGNASILEDNMGTTNGIEVSPDEKHLYVNEGIERRVWRYDLDKKTGNVSHKKLLINFPDFGVDGMRCDEAGNLYIARYSGSSVDVVSPKGKIIRHIALKGRDPTNVAFGGADGKTLFVTLQDRGAVEFLRVDHAGREWRLHKH